MAVRDSCRDGGSLVVKSKGGGNNPETKSVQELTQSQMRCAAFEQTENSRSQKRRYSRRIRPTMASRCPLQRWDAMDTPKTT